MSAAMAGNHELIKILLESGATQDKMDRDSLTAPALAAEQGDYETAKLLLSLQRDPDAVNTLINSCRDKLGSLPSRQDCMKYLLPIRTTHEKVDL